MKKGAPSKDVTIPIGSSVGATTVLAIKSEHNNKVAPKIIEAGINDIKNDAITFIFKLVLSGAELANPSS